MRCFGERGRERIQREGEDVGKQLHFKFQSQSSISMAEMEC